MATFIFPPTSTSSGGAGVVTLNGLAGAVTLSAGSGVTLTPAGNNIQIATSGSAFNGGTITNPLTINAPGSGQVDALVLTSSGNTDMIIKNTGAGVNGLLIGNAGSLSSNYQIYNLDLGSFSITSQNIILNPLGFPPTTGYLLAAADNTGTIAWVPANSANLALSNLGATAIPVSLVPNAAATYNLGSAALRWNVLFADAIYDSASSQVMDISNRNLTAVGGQNIIDFATPGNVKIKSGGKLSFLNAAETNSTAFQAGSPSASVTYTLPPADGTVNQVLSTDGSANLNWTTPSSGANVSLSNLSATSINQGLVFGNGTPGVLQTTNRVLVSPEALTIKTGNTIGANGAPLSISTGTTDTSSGSISVVTGTAGNFTGDVDIITGNSTFQHSGALTIKSGDSANDNSGFVLLKTGTAGITRGAIMLQNGTESVGAGAVWTSTNTSGAGQWALPAVSGANTSLSNLTNPTSVNQDLRPSLNNTKKLGSPVLQWLESYSYRTFSLDVAQSSYVTLSADLASAGGSAGYGVALSGIANKEMYFETIQSAINDAVATNNVTVRSGNKTAGTGNSGSVSIITGTSAGGSRGNAVVNSNLLVIPKFAADPTTNLVAGGIYYNTTTNKIKMYNGTTFETVTSV